MDVKIKLPTDVEFILNKLNEHGEGLLVGGAVRDLLLDKQPKDYDFATNIPYDRLLSIFSEYDPKEIGKAFGIIQIKIDGEEYEIAKYRQDGEYLDNRHPDTVNFVDNFYEDAKRRDFTINAMGYDGNKIYDFFNGKDDLKQGIIKFVGLPSKRIQEDALRMMRCIRFATNLEFELDLDCFYHILENSELINNISKERIQMELNKILLSDNPSRGIRLLENNGLLKYIIPELQECVNFNQNNSHHDKDLFNHILTVVNNTNKNLPLRLAALFHDIAKPQCHSIDEKGESHYNLHHKESADMAEIILKRLKYDNETINVVKKLIYDHMNKSSKQTDKAIKRFINRVGVENLDSMFSLLRADIIGHKPPHNFESLDNLIIKCQEFLNKKDPIEKSSLEINGKDIMGLGIKEGKLVGQILDFCMDVVLDFPERNNKQDLIDLINLNFLSRPKIEININE